jgi:anti-sigma regulatory factor (Ser/Thr protein kinase)
MKAKFQSYRFWWYNILAWTAYYVVLAFFSPFCLAYPPVERFFYLLPSWALIVFVTSLYRFVYRRFHFDDSNLLKIVFQVVISTIIVWEIDVFLRFNLVYKEILPLIYPNIAEVITRTPYGRALNFIYQQVQQKDNNWIHFDTSFNDLNQLIKFTCIVIWMVIYNFIHYNKRFQDIKYANLINENKLKEAELTNLRQQLNPHFLFNALNSIQALVSLKDDKAEAAVLNLSDLMRYHLNYEKRDFITVKEEMETVKKYLELEKIRFDKRLNYEVKVEEAVLNQQIPLIMVQTLVENAIKHSIRHNPKSGYIHVRACQEGDFLKIEVSNSGQFSPNSKNSYQTISSQEKDKKGGIGLENTRRRLTMHYGNKASFSIGNSDENEVKATLMFPLKKTPQ